VVEDVAADPLWTDYRDAALAHGLRACWSTPLLSGAGQVLGTLACYYRSVRRPGEDELRLVERAGHLAALAIERHRAIEAIARSEEQRRTMLVNIPDVVWWIDRDDRVLFISPGIETLIGYTAAELTQAGRRAWLELVHPDDMRRVAEGWTALFDDGAPYNVEYRLRRGEDGEPSAYGVISDVTERKQAADIRTRLLDQVMSAQEDERRRIARELHDETAQSLASLLVGLDVLAATRTRKAARAQVQELHRVAARALGEVRLLARGLRPAVLDDLGLVAAVEWYAGEFQRSRGIAVYSRAIGVTGRLPAPVETALYRIMQEALANVSRHAEARAASVVIERRPRSVTMAVSDDGRGFDAGKVLTASESAGQLGLHSMRERALLLDGTVEVSSVTGAGTRILVELPLPEEARPATRPAEAATR
jgi:PAS domain S-box-containing protein